MKFSYLFYTLIILTVFFSCTRCEDCDNLYYEPGVKVTFYKQSDKKDTLQINDTLRVDIKSFNGLTDVPFITNQGRATYFFPIPMDTTLDSTVYNIEYHNLVKDSIEVDSFTLKYDLRVGFEDRRLLLFPINIAIESYAEKDTIDDEFKTCSTCGNASGQVNIYE